jgi:hypothetical protein
MESSENQIKNIVKGKIGEIFTERILRDSGYIVLPYGYENHFGYLVNRVVESGNVRKVLSITRMTPDFIVLSKIKDNCFFIEAKFRTNLDIDKFIKSTVRPTDKYWKQVYFFVVTPKPPYFYYDFVNNILKNRKLKTLKEWGPRIGITEDIIERYEKIAAEELKKFI